MKKYYVTGKHRVTGDEKRFRMWCALIDSAGAFGDVIDEEGGGLLITNAVFTADYVVNDCIVEDEPEGM